MRRPRAKFSISTSEFWEYFNSFDFVNYVHMGEAKRRREFMDDEFKKELTGEVPVMGELKITMYQNGNFKMESTTQDKMFLYGLLEMAKDAIRSQGKSNVVKIPMGVIPDRILKGN
jgi:hypothetical protein